LSLTNNNENQKRIISSHSTTCKGETGSATLHIPDPRGSLSPAISAQAITEANSKHRRQLKTWLEVTKRGPDKYSLNLQSEIGKYTSQHGVAAAAWHFSRKLN